MAINIERHLREFATASAYTAAVNNEELNYPNVSYIDETGAVAIDATSPIHNYSQDYFTIVSLEDNNAITWNRSSIYLYLDTVSASTDNGATWTAISAGGGATTLATLNTGDKLLLKSELNRVGRIASTGQFEVEGNSMSLLYGDNFSGQTSLSDKTSAFTAVFSGCTGLTSAEHLVLPATTLSISCYYSMFNKCTSLTAAPALPATILESYCYQNMFKGCTSLVTAPELPATTMVLGCYFDMFNGCTSLNYVKMTATNITAFNCLNRWLWNVAASGTFVKATGVEIASGESGIPDGWTVQEV